MIITFKKESGGWMRKDKIKIMYSFYERVTSIFSTLIPFVTRRNTKIFSMPLLIFMYSVMCLYEKKSV